MKRNLLFLLALILIPLLAGCGEEEGGTATQSSAAQGWHFPGRNCLACHNYDLQTQRHLLFGGTLYKNENITDKDDLNQICGGDLIVNLLDTNSNLVYSSKDYTDPNSKGSRGKGNIFILKRMLSSAYGNFYIQITDKNSNVLAVSPLHYFSAQEYDINNPTDQLNKISCNACHSAQGIQPPVYVQINKNLCE